MIKVFSKQEDGTILEHGPRGSDSGFSSGDEATAWGFKAEKATLEHDGVKLEWWWDEV